MKDFNAEGGYRRDPLRPVVEQVDTAVSRPGGTAAAQADAGSSPAGATPDGLPSCGICEGSGEWHCTRCGCDFCGRCIAFAHHDCPGNVGETRECENCGKQKPIEEMETVFARGHGETYQCIDCRGGP